MMRRFILICVACLLSVNAAAEESLRCGNKIVTIGMTSAEVLNRWIYERGTTGKPKVLEFDQDKLISIEQVFPDDESP